MKWLIPPTTVYTRVSSIEEIRLFVSVYFAPFEDCDCPAPKLYFVPYKRGGNVIVIHWGDLLGPEDLIYEWDEDLSVKENQKEAILAVKEVLP